MFDFRMKLIAALLLIFGLGTIAAPDIAFAQTSSCVATTAAPTWADGTPHGLSCDTSGNLRSVGGGSGTTATQIQGNVANLGTDAPSNPVKVGCVFQTTPPAPAVGQRVDCQAGPGGEIVEYPRTIGLLLGDGLTNTPVMSRGISNAGASTVIFNGSYGYYLNGSTLWDRMRGDVNGAWSQGNVASGVANVGNPLQNGGIGSNTFPSAVTAGQRVGAWLSLNGAQVIAAPQTTFADTVSNTLTGQVPFTNGNQGPLQIAPTVFNGVTIDRQFTCPTTAVINVAAGTTAQLVALSGALNIRVCSTVLTESLAGTAKFVSGTGANCGTGTADVTGAMQLTTGGNISLSAPEGGSLFRAGASNALCLTTVTGIITGFVTYAQF